VLGRTGVSIMERQAVPVSLTNTAAMEKPTYRSAAELFKSIHALGGEINVAYNSFKSTISQVPAVVKLDDLAAGAAPADFLLEPEPAALVSQLHYHYLECRFFKIILESQLGELSARLILLKGATDTSQDMARDLQLAINKLRQASITRELLEIVSAAEAVRSDYE
jgi:F-type H+-transporting ATPase subunit gamma